MIFGFQRPSALMFLPVSLLFLLPLILNGCSSQPNAPMISPSPSPPATDPQMITPSPSMAAPNAQSSPTLEPRMIPTSPTPAPSSQESSAPRSEPSMIPTAPR